MGKEAFKNIGSYKGTLVENIAHSLYKIILSPHLTMSIGSWNCRKMMHNNFNFTTA